MSNEITAPISVIANSITAPVTLGIIGIIGSGGASTWASITGKPITVATGKTITVSNTMTLAGTDSSTLNIGAGGTLGSAAFTAASSYASSAQGTLADNAVPTTRTINSVDLSANRTLADLGIASRQAIKSTDFTAVAYGRYHTTGNVTVTRPASGTFGDIFDVLVASGTATIEGVTYSATRFPIEVVCISGGTPGTWIVPAGALPVSGGGTGGSSQPAAWTGLGGSGTISSPTFTNGTFANGTATVLTVGDQTSNSSAGTITWRGKSGGGTNLSASWVMRSNAYFALDAYGGTDAIRVDASNGRVAFTRGMEGDSYYNGKLSIGTAAPADENAGLLVVSKGYATATGNHHAIRVTSTDAVLAAGAGVCFFDSQAIVSSPNNIDHIAEFQARSSKTGAGTMSDWFGYWTSPVFSLGTTARAAHVNIEDAKGAGTLTTQYGIRIKALTKAATNYAIVTEGTAGVVFGGTLAVTGATTATGGLILGSFTVSTFPSTTYLMGVVTDALAPVVGADVASGGSAKCIVCYNGTSKIVTALL